jgi:hypothetical protein
MRASKARLAVAAVLFLAWIGYLVYLVVTTTRPEVHLWPPEVTRRPPVVLSRPQFLVSDLDLVAEVKDRNGQPDSQVTVKKVQWVRDEKERPAAPEIVVVNLPGAQGWEGPGDYILPLGRDGKVYRVVAIPRSPGFDGPPDHRTRIYPATAETERQLVRIPKPEPRAE